MSITFIIISVYKFYIVKFVTFLTFSLILIIVSIIDFLVLETKFNYFLEKPNMLGLRKQKC